MNTVRGIVIDRAPSGKPLYAHIDLRKYSRELASFFSEKGIELEPVKLSSKMKRSLKQAQKGEVSEGDIENFWNV